MKHSNLHRSDYANSKDHSHMHLPLWISMHSKGKNSIQLKWKYPPNKALHQELREEWEKHKLKGNCKTIFIILQEHPLLISGSVHQACYSFRGAAEGGKLKGKNQIHHNAPGQSWGCCNVHDWIKHVCLQVFISVTNMELSSSRIVAIHKRDPWWFHVYPCS